MVTSRASRLVVSAAFLLSLSAGGVFAQDQRPPLRGPDVRDASPPGEKNSFVRGGKDRKDRKDQAGDRGGPMQMMRAINALHGPDTPEDLRLSPEQDQQLKGIMDVVHDDMRAFRDAHGQEIRDLVKSLSPEARKKALERLRPFMGGEPGAKGKGPGGQGPDGQGPGGKGKGHGPEGRDGPGPNGPDGHGPDGNGPKGRHHKGDQPPPPPPGGDPMDEMRPGNGPKDEAAALDRLRDLADQAPDLKGAETKAWNVLTDPQKDFVKGVMEKQRKDAEQRMLDNPPERAKEKARRQIDKKSPDAAAAGNNDRPALNAQDRQRLRERIPPELREKLRDMSPEERRDAIRKWMDENGGPDAPKNPK